MSSFYSYLLENLPVALVDHFSSAKGMGLGPFAVSLCASIFSHAMSFSGLANGQPCYTYDWAFELASRLADDSFSDVFWKRIRSVCH